MPFLRLILKNDGKDLTKMLNVVRILASKQASKRSETALFCQAFFQKNVPRIFEDRKARGGSPPGVLRSFCVPLLTSFYLMT